MFEECETLFKDELYRQFVHSVEEGSATAAALACQRDDLHAVRKVGELFDSCMGPFKEFCANASVSMTTEASTASSTSTSSAPAPQQPQQQKKKKKKGNINSYNIYCRDKMKDEEIARKAKEMSTPKMSLIAKMWKEDVTDKEKEEFAAIARAENERILMEQEQEEEQS